MDSRIEKQLFECLIELANNSLKIHNAIDCKTKEGTAPITSDNDCSHNKDVVQHDEQDNLSKHIELLKQHILEFGRDNAFVIPYDSLILNEIVHRSRSHMSSACKTYIVQNLIESASNLTEQICNLMYIYKTKGNLKNKQIISNCLTSITIDIKTIPQFDMQNSIDSESQISNADLNDSLSDALAVLIKHVAKLKKAYAKEMCKEAKAVAKRKNRKILKNTIKKKFKKELHDIINIAISDDSDLDTDVTSSKKPVNTFENVKQKRKLCKIDNDNNNSIPAIVDETIEKDAVEKPLRKKLLKKMLDNTSPDNECKEQHQIINITISDESDLDTKVKSPKKLNNNFGNVKKKHKLSSIDNDKNTNIPTNNNLDTDVEKHNNNFENETDKTNSIPTRVDQKVENCRIVKTDTKTCEREQGEATRLAADHQFLIKISDWCKKQKQRQETSETMQIEPVLPKLEQIDNTNDSILTLNDDEQVTVKNENKDENNLGNVKKRKLSCIKNEFCDANNSVTINANRITERELFRKQLKSNKMMKKLLEKKTKDTTVKSGAIRKPKTSQELLIAPIIPKLEPVDISNDDEQKIVTDELNQTPATNQAMQIKPKIEQEEVKSENKPDSNDRSNYYLAKSDDGAPRILNDDEESNILENVMHNEYLSEKEKLMYFKELIYSVNSKTEMSSETEKKLNDLHIVIDWEVPAAHLVERFLTRGPNVDESKILQELGVKFLGFSTEEDNKIKQNWHNFCKSHDLNNDPKPFLLLRCNNKFTMSYEERKKFIRYLGKGLPNRALSSIYRRFKLLFGDYKQGRFTAEEDNIILSIAKTNISNRFAQLGLLLKRPRRAIQERFVHITDAFYKPDRKVVWSLSMKEVLVKTIMKLTHKKSIEELRVANVSNAILAVAAEKMKLSRSIVRNFWHTALSTKLFASKRIRINPLRVKLIKCMIRLGFNDWKQDMWGTVAAEFPGLSKQFIHMQIRSVVYLYVPPHLWSDLEDSLAYLKKKWIPLIKNKANYKSRCLKRLQLNETGKLIEIE